VCCGWAGIGIAGKSENIVSVPTSANGTRSLDEVLWRERLLNEIKLSNPVIVRATFVSVMWGMISEDPAHACGITRHQTVLASIDPKAYHNLEQVAYRLYFGNSNQKAAINILNYSFLPPETSLTCEAGVVPRSTQCAMSLVASRTVIQGRKPARPKDG
jgi:hypothetical protein